MPGRIASPGTKRVKLSGILAVSDDFDRIRLIILKNTKDGKKDYTWNTLINAVPRLHRDYKLPYDHKEDVDSYGVVWFVAPTHRRKYWLEEAERLRGFYVSIEATVRPFKSGMSLDISLIDQIL